MALMVVNAKLTMDTENGPKDRQYLVGGSCMYRKHWTMEVSGLISLDPSSLYHWFRLLLVVVSWSGEDFLGARLGPAVPIKCYC